ncbi:MAG: hypothetical protein P8X57_09625, partial [Cyclobacteriaceae bacterium]
MARLSIRRFFKEERVLFFAIGIIAVLILHNFIVGLYSKSAQNKFNEFQDTQRDALFRIEQIGRYVNLIDLGFRGFYVIPEEQLLSPLNIARREFPINMDSLALIMDEMGYPHIDSIHTVTGWMNEYMELADQGVAYVNEGRPDEAVELFASDPGYDLWLKYDKVQRSMQEHVNALNEEKLLFNKAITQYAFVSQLALAFFGLLTLGFVVFKLRKNEQAINGLFEQIKESDQIYVYNDGESR